MSEKVTLRACPHCGSMDTHPALLFGGPLPWVDHNDGGYICRNCGRTAVPLDFNDLEELKAFQRSLAEKLADVLSGFIHIPIMPIDTKSLLRIPVIDLPVAQITDVVEVEWDGSYVIKGQRTRFSRYWKAVQGPRYSAKEVVVLDLAGINDGRPNFDVLKALIRSKHQVWLDLGMRDVQDLFDSFTMDVSRALVGTMTAPDMGIFEEVFELSDRAVPCVHLAGDVVWRSRKGGPRALEDAIAELADIGYEEIGVIDLPRLGRRTGADQRLVDRLSRLDAGIILGGGVVEKDLEGLRAAGLKGAFMDPFTSMISELIAEEGRALPSESEASATTYVSKNAVRSPDGSPLSY